MAEQSHTKAAHPRRLPLDLVQSILDQIRLVDWSGDSAAAQWHGNPFQWQIQRVESENHANIPTKHALSLVSKELRTLTESMVYEHICVWNAHQLCKLGQSIQRYQSLSKSIARYTRRLDILISEEPAHNSNRVWNMNAPNATAARSVASVYTVAESLLRNCPSLTHLTISMFNEPVGAFEGHGITKVIAEACPSLRVLHWRFASKIRLSPLARAFADNLRVLDLSKTALFSRSKDIGAIEMPYLHTLKGPIDVLCRALVSVRLPSLQALVLDVRSGSNFRHEDVQEFLNTHKDRIKTLIVLSPRLKVELDEMEVLNEFAFNAAMKDQLTMPSFLPHLTRIGIMGSDDDVPEPPTTTHGKAAETDTIVVCLCVVCDDILESRRTHYPELNAVRLVDPRLVKHVQGNWLACQKLVGKFLIAGIRFEDDRGDLIHAVLGPEPVQFKGKTVSRIATDPYRARTIAMRNRQLRSPRSKTAERRRTPSVDESGIAKAFEFSLVLTPTIFQDILRR